MTVITEMHEFIETFEILDLNNVLAIFKSLRLQNASKIIKADKFN